MVHDNLGARDNFFGESLENQLATVCCYQVSEEEERERKKSSMMEYVASYRSKTEDKISEFA